MRIETILNHCCRHKSFVCAGCVLGASLTGSISFSISARPSTRSGRRRSGNFQSAVAASAPSAMMRASFFETVGWQYHGA